MRDILDMGRQELILPGRGDAEITWPSGTLRLPLSRAPSGHSVLIIDDFERAMQSAAGGLPERTLQLHSRTGESETEAEEMESPSRAEQRETLGSQ